MSVSAWFRTGVQCLCVCAGITAIVFYSIQLHRDGKLGKAKISYLSAACFSFLAGIISVRAILLHLTHWTRPYSQKHAVRILGLVPVYALESFLALRFRKNALLIETIRDSYEAYTIYSFFYFLLSLLGDEEQLLKILRSKVNRGAHPWPLNLLISPWASAGEILLRCKTGILQYVVLKNVCTLAILITSSLGVYNEGVFSLTGGSYFYITAISSTSQLIALYCLILFYFVTKEELTPFRPVSKYVTVKMVVFFSFWQTLGVSLIAHHTSWLGNAQFDGWTTQEIAQGIADYAINLEMVPAAVAFSYAFSHRDFLGGTGGGKPRHQHSRDSNDPGENSTEEDDVHEGRPFLALLSASVPSDFLVELHSTMTSTAPLKSPM